MSKLWLFVTYFMLLGSASISAAEKERCLISNLRFDQNMRLYDFVVIEPDFFYVTRVVGYKEADGVLQPAVGEGQEFRRGEKGFGLKTIYTTDKTLAQGAASGINTFRGKIKRDSYLESWELILDSYRMPIKLTRHVTKNDGSKVAYVCERPETEAWEWYSTPFAKEVVGYNIIRPIPTITPE